MKKIIVLIVILVSVSTGFVCFKQETNKLSTKEKNKSTEVVKQVEKQTDEELEDVDNIEVEEEKSSIDKVTEEKEQETKKETPKSNSNNTTTKENNSTSNKSSSNSSNNSNEPQNNSQSAEQNTQNTQNNQSVPTVDGNAVNKNTIDYSTHKGRTDNCNSSSSCTEKGLNFYLKYKRVIANYFVLDVTANNGNILGYFIEYVFKEGEYDTEVECNSVGSSIKSELSDRVTGFRCSSRNNKFYLNITTDYD